MMDLTVRYRCCCLFLSFLSKQYLDLFDFADSLEHPVVVGPFLLSLTFPTDSHCFQNHAESHDVDSNMEDEDSEGLADENMDSEVEAEEEEEEWEGIEEQSDCSSDHETEDSGPSAETILPSTSASPGVPFPVLCHMLYANPFSATRYVPPHLRAKADSKETEEQIKLTRQLKGLLNRCVDYDSYIITF